MMRILDLGCGNGINIEFFKAGNGTVFGLDINLASLSEAARNFFQRKLVFGSGESIPLRDCSMDAVVSNVALCIMNIPKTLGEIHRVLVPGGTLAATLHYFAFTRSELTSHRKLRSKGLPPLRYVQRFGVLFERMGSWGIVPDRTWNENRPEACWIRQCDVFAVVAGLDLWKRKSVA